MHTDTSRLAAARNNGFCTSIPDGPQPQNVRDIVYCIGLRILCCKKMKTCQAQICTSFIIVLLENVTWKSSDGYSLQMIDSKMWNGSDCDRED